MFPVSFILVRSELLTIHHLRMELLRGSWVDVRLGTEVLLLHSAVSVVLHVDVLHFFIFSFEDLLLLTAIQRTCTRREHRPCTTSACVSNRSTCRKRPTVQRGSSRTRRTPASWFSCTRWSPPSIFFSPFSSFKRGGFFPRTAAAMRCDATCSVVSRRNGTWLCLLTHETETGHNRGTVTVVGEGEIAKAKMVASGRRGASNTPRVNGLHAPQDTAKGR